jgi:SAM-dependent methyltransferase
VLCGDIEMKWRGTQSASRKRYIEKFDTEEVDRYESWILQLTREDDEAVLSDISRVFKFRGGMSVLDVGAGTGALCRILSQIPQLFITAMEPSPAMLEKLRTKPELKNVTVVEGFCDSHNDHEYFDDSTFDVIVSRQLVNGLFDPLTAFHNWHRWLKNDGSVIVIDGLYNRSAWTERWEEEIDVLPLSACQTISTIPYLLEATGFKINAVNYMKSTNLIPSTRTKRYIVVASKPA